MQALHASYYPDGNVPIAWWLLAYGTIQLALSQIPTMHQLRHLNAAAVLMTAAWTIMVAVECVRQGAHTAHCVAGMEWAAWHTKPATPCTQDATAAPSGAVDAEHSNNPAGRSGSPAGGHAGQLFPGGGAKADHGAEFL